MVVSKNYLLIAFAALTMFGCKVGKGDKPLVGGVHKEGKLITESEEADAWDEESKDQNEERSLFNMEENAERSAEVNHHDRYLPATLSDRPEQLLQRKAYTTSYNRETRLPNWVAWTLTAERTNGKHSRKGRNFQEDMDVSSPRATHYDYMRSQYDRGHMCPSGDNKWDATAQNESFLLTNICPQNHNLNTGDWNDIEIQCRRWAQRYGKIYIVCGPILYNQKHKTIGRNRVTVPEAFFKVVLRLGKRPQAIAFICRNESGSRPLREYVHSLKEAERITGIHFFERLDQNIRTQIEDKVDPHEWGI